MILLIINHNMPLHTKESACVFHPSFRARQGKSGAESNTPAVRATREEMEMKDGEAVCLEMYGLQERLFWR